MYAKYDLLNQDTIDLGHFFSLSVYRAILCGHGLERLKNGIGNKVILGVQRKKIECIK